MGLSYGDDASTWIHGNEAAIEVCEGITGYLYVFKRDDFVLRGNSKWFATKEVKPLAVFKSSFVDIGLPILSSKPI